MSDPWCVQWTKPAPGGWCATLNNAEPSAEAFSDDTACGWSVTMRVGSAQRPPTCVECIAALARAQGVGGGDGSGDGTR